MDRFFQALALVLVTVSAILVLRKRASEFALVLSLLCIRRPVLFCPDHAAASIGHAGTAGGALRRQHGHPGTSH